MDGKLAKRYGEDADGSVARIGVGETFDVRLPENRSTGYRWAHTDWDQAIVQLTSDEFIPAPIERVGANGEHAWHFTARAAGETALRLGYARGWESRAPAKTFTLHVAVSG